MELSIENYVVLSENNAHVGVTMEKKNIYQVKKTCPADTYQVLQPQLNVLIEKRCGRLKLYYTYDNRHFNNEKNPDRFCTYGCCGKIERGVIHKYVNDTT